VTEPSALALRVAKVVDEAQNIRSVELVDPEGSVLPAFTAGAHVDVHLGGGLVRQYSLCNAPSERHRYVIGVLNDPQGRGGSRAVHALGVGDTVRVGMPRNQFELLPDGRSLLIAGGIGITPILCMARSLEAQHRPFELHYATRTRANTAFMKELQASSFADSVFHYWSQEPDSARLDLTQLLARPSDGVHLYMCGPRSFMDAVLQTARDRGWPESQIHYEYFAADVVRLDADEAFEVRIASTGKTVEVANDETVVEALARAGIDIPTSCEQGICGTCLTGVVAGVPDHRDMFLTPEEQACNDRFLPCCSRSRSATLVLAI